MVVTSLHSIGAAAERLRKSRGQAGARSACPPPCGASRPTPLRKTVTTTPKRKPPTCAKNATPPPFALAPKSPKLAPKSWYRNQKPRKNQAEMRIGKIPKSPNTVELG